MSQTIRLALTLKHILRQTQEIGAVGFFINGGLNGVHQVKPELRFLASSAMPSNPRHKLVAGKSHQTFGERVQADRKAIGYTQDDLVKRLNDIKGNLRPKDSEGNDVKARKTWLVHLEHGRIKNLDEPRRRWIAKALKADSSLYVTLPMTGVESESRDDEPDELEFEELWIISSMPLELNEVGYPDRMAPHLDDDSKQIVYFLPNDAVAEALKNRLRRLQKSLTNVSIVVNPHVLMSPHWIVRHISSRGETPDSDAWVLTRNMGPRGEQRQFVQMPEQKALDMIQLLESYHLLDKDCRFDPGKLKDSSEISFRLYDLAS